MGSACHVVTDRLLARFCCGFDRPEAPLARACPGTGPANKGLHSKQRKVLILKTHIARTGLGAVPAWLQPGGDKRRGAHSFFDCTRMR